MKRPCSNGLQGLFSILRTKGMGEIFHGQTKGYMFACDQLHDINISWAKVGYKALVHYFTRLSYSTHGVHFHYISIKKQVVLTLLEEWD
jgi:hypothetical protein